LKKSTRILAILMAFVMLIGSMSVMGSAYEAYKGDAIKNQYNDVDKVDFTLEQSASMALDELDRMLAKEQMVLDIYIGTLNLASVNDTLTSVISLVGSVQSLLPLLGDATSLPSFIVPLEGIQRFEDSDMDVVYALLDFIANIAPLAEKFVNGTIDLGIMDSFIADFKFDVRNLAIGLLYGMTKQGKAEDYDAMDDGAAGLPDKYKDPTKDGALTLLQDLLIELVLGEWKQLDEEFNDPYSVVMYESYGFMDKYGETAPDTENYDYYGWVHPKDWVTVGLGDCIRVNKGEACPAGNYYSVIDITTDAKGYEFIERLMQTAYNQLLVPVLNRDTVPWVRRLCGVEYLDKYTKRTLYGDDPATAVVEGQGDVPAVWYNNPDYNPSYTGEAFDEAELNKTNVYSKLFKMDAVKIPTTTIPDGETFVDNFNDVLGDVVTTVAKNNVLDEVTNDTYTWTWQYGSNEYLFDNIVSVGKFVLQVTGEHFFGETAFKEEFPSAAQIGKMGEQEVVSLIMKAILNSSVDWMYIESEYKTIVDVGYRAVEQLAWQDIPQFTYVKPVESDYSTTEEYYAAVVDKALDILFDVAVYNLNQGFDMVPASGSNPVEGDGLLQYGGDYEDKLVQIAAWAISEYGPILVGDKVQFFCDDYNGEVGDLTADHVWQDLDTIINALIPIKGSGAWISSEIAGNGNEIVSKKFIFDYLLKPIYMLDATNLAEIFARNSSSQFAEDNGVEIIMSILTNVFELIFPGVFQAKDTIDEVLNNQLLGAMVGDLVKSLGTKDTTNALNKTLKAKGPAIAQVALPLVCMLLGLSDDQEFEEMEIFIDEAIPSTQADANAPTFQIYNGSSGINTAHTAEDGTVTQDKLYSYTITNIYVYTYDASGNNTNALSASVTSGTLSGGDSMEVALNGTRTEGNLVEIQVFYNIYGETGAQLTGERLSSTVYTYVGATSEDDDAIETKVGVGNGTVQYYPSIYLSAGDDLSDIESYSIRIKDAEAKAAATATVNTVTNASTEYPFAAKNAAANETAVSMTGEGGVYFLNPFDVATKADGTAYERLELNYVKDDEGNIIYDEETGEPTPDGTDNGGVKDGQYNVTTNITAYGQSYDVVTAIQLYDDYGLESMFSRAVAANRQRSDYENEFEGAWNAYVAALKEAARLVLKPKAARSFQSDIAIAASTGYANKYEMLAENLENAIIELEKFAANTGTAGLKAALNEYSGANYTIEADENGYPYKAELEYDDPNYIYFGMRDYVPHTYNKYRDARDRVESLIASQEFFVMDPFEEGYEPSEEDIGRYNDSVAAYLEAVANMDVIGSIESTYAIHMLNLTGRRLIRLEGDTSKLEMLYDLYGNAKDAEASYTESSEEAYDRAVAFAAGVIAESDPLPSKINRATSELVEAYKKLAESASYVALDAAIAAAKAVIDRTGTDANKQTTYTPESYQALLDAYNAALEAEKDLSDTESNNTYLANLTSNLTTAQANLAAPSVGEASFEFVTEDTGMFWDAGFNMSFIPQISQGALTHEYFFQTLEDGTEVNGYLVGLGEFIADEETLLSAFASLENCTANVTLNDQDLISTGTIIQITNDSTGEVMATYIVVVVGDIDGNGGCDTGDEAPLFDNVNGKTDWEWGGYEQYKAAAADINNDGSFDVGDVPFIGYVGSGNGYINQNVSPDWESSYVSLY